MGGGGDQDSTTTTNQEFATEFRPLAKSSVEEIQRAQGLLPLAPFTQWQPGAVAGLTPAHTFAIETLLPGAAAPTQGLHGLLGLAKPVGAAARGAVGAAGPMGAETEAMRILFTDAGGRPDAGGAPSTQGFELALPDFSFGADDTVFSGVSQQALQAASPALAQGATPILGGGELSTVNPSQPMERFPGPPSMPDEGLASILPPDARAAYRQFLAEGWPPSLAYQKALELALNPPADEGAAAAVPVPVPVADPNSGGP